VKAISVVERNLDKRIANTIGTSGTTCLGQASKAWFDDDPSQAGEVPMARTVWAGLTLLAGMSLASWGLIAQEPPVSEPGADPIADSQPAAAAETEAPVDQTAIYRAYQQAHGSELQKQFEPGTVTVRTLAADAIKPTANGFEIQFPSQAPIPTPAVVGKRLFVSGGFHSREYYCFDAATGQLAWAVDLSDDGPSSAVESDGVLLFNTESCTIFALDAATGKHLWSAWLGDPLVSTPTIAQGRVYTIYPVGHGQAEMQQQLAPAIQENELVAQPKAEGEDIAPRHALICFELKTGKILWQHFVDHDAITAPVAAGEELYVATLAGTMFRFRAADGHLISARKERATSVMSRI
jgi:outer membrane protein assembly factor BamB